MSGRLSRRLRFRVARKTFCARSRTGWAVAVRPARIIHVGFEAVEGDGVEALRHERIVASMADFDPGDTPLEYVYSHFLAPENPPDQGWAYDETVDYRSIRAARQPPLQNPFLVLGPDGGPRRGGHWQP